MKAGTETVIDYDNVYDAEVLSKEEALHLIAEYGEIQRKKYDNPKVQELEKRMESIYGLSAVNLGEMDMETAQEIEAAFRYMYQEYPCLQGSLTNVTLGNFDRRSGGKVAITEFREFIIHREYGQFPYVVKHQLVLGAGSFLNRERLLNTCKTLEESGYWPKGANITSIVVHELGHQLLNVIAQQQFGLEKARYDSDEYDTSPNGRLPETAMSAAWYITEHNGEAYSRYLTDSLSSNQTVPKSVLEQAYVKWKTEYNHTGDEKAFRESISQYAMGEQEDGGISYTETFAEAFADIYLNGEDAADASKAIMETAKEMLR